MSRIPWLVYRRTRPSLGTALGFMLMFSFVSGGFGKEILLSAVGLFLIHLFGDCYNDCYDTHEDARNRRADKLILSGSVSVGGMKAASVALALAGLLVLAFVPAMLIPGMWCLLLGFAYSHPSVRLKRFSLFTYMLGGTVWAIAIPTLSMTLEGGLTQAAAALSAFAFFQYVYILCQKDSTDGKDTANLFLSMGRRVSSLVTIMFGAGSSAALLVLTASNPLLLPVWAVNLASKALNVSRIRSGKITRKERSNYILVEFLTPYAYFLSVLLFA